jgi:hypothetical protein
VLFTTKNQALVSAGQQRFLTESIYPPGINVSSSLFATPCVNIMPGPSPTRGKRMAYRCVLTAALLLSAASSVAAASMQSVPSGYDNVALQHAVPTESLCSLALAESSRKLPQGKRPRPWTINVAGKGYRYKSWHAAWQALQQFMKSHPLKQIDVVIAKVNLGWNGHPSAQNQPVYNRNWPSGDHT